jgi:hypothetical protein
MHAGLVIPYATLVYDGPDWTLVEAETRAFGLLTAGCVALLVHRFVWPALPLRDLRRSIGASLTDIGSKLGNLLQHAGPADPTEAPRHLLPLSAVVPKVLSLSNDARYLFSVIDEDSRHFHNVIQGLMSLDVHLSLVSGVIGRLEPAVLEQFRVAVAPTVARLAEGCRSAGAMFEPAPAPPTPAGRGAGAAMEALKPLDAKLRARGPAGEEQRHYVWLLGRSLDHLAAGLDEIVTEADAINRTRPGAGERS